MGAKTAENLFLGFGCQRKGEERYFAKVSGNLFVFEEHPDLGIPNTTNLLDGVFAGLKRYLECHHGLSKANKIKFIQDYFSEK